MGRIFPLGAALAGAILAATPSFATDLRVPPIFVKAPPVQMWSGPYVGVNIGYGWGHWDSNGSGGPYDLAPSPKVDGGFGGVQAGYNWQRDRFVLGVEGDIQISGISGSSNVQSIPGKPSICNTASVTSVFSTRCVNIQPVPQQICSPAVPGSTVSGNWDLPWFATLRARAGWTIDRSMVFVTAGPAFGETKYASGSSSESKVKAGWAIGTGIETIIARNWTMKAEYLYLDLGTETFNGSTSNPMTSRIQEHLVRVGANYQIRP